jgi:hypothetical protein
VTAIPNSTPTKAVVFAPLGRDAAVAAALLKELRISSTICADLVAFKNSLNIEACFALVTEEALRSVDLRGIVARLNQQPA